MKSIGRSDVEACEKVYRDTSKELALNRHKEAQKTQDRDTYQLAKHLYAGFLDHFPKDSDAYDLAFYYAELLYREEEWKAAAEQYTKVVEMNPSGKYAKETAYAAVISWKNALNLDAEGASPEDRALLAKAQKEKAKGGKPTEVAIPENQTKMIAAFDTYIKYVPDAPESAVIKYRKARIFYEFNHFDEAAKLFGEIVEQHKGHELALYSADLMLDSLNAIGRTKEACLTVDRFIQDPGPMKSDPGFFRHLKKIQSDCKRIDDKR